VLRLIEVGAEIAKRWVLREQKMGAEIAKMGATYLACGCGWLPFSANPLTGV